MSDTMTLPATLKPVSLTVTTAAIRAYADLTSDMNPIHLDPDFAARTPMGGVIAHGTMSLNLIWQALAQSLPATAIAAGTLQLRFVKPVRIGQVVTGRGQRQGDGTAAYEVWVENNEGVRVIEGAFILAA